MFSVKWQKAALEGIRIFSERYEECFVSLFHDSGIWCESVIIEKYRFAGKELNRNFVDEIAQRLKEDIVLGRKKRTEWFEIGFRVDHRFLKVNYTENEKEKQRIIEWVSINQK